MQSVLSQELPENLRLEVVVVVSDPASPVDVEAATRLAEDERVSMLLAPRPGPAAARNSGIEAATGSIVAFIDDDCVAQSGWLSAAVGRLGDADLVQGRTEPADPVRLTDRTLWVSPPSWLWESCNLVVRREAIDRSGMFDESINPTGRIGGHFGEDIEWGWRLVRSGARPAFADEMLVLHAVEPGTLGRYLSEHARVRYFPQLLRLAPETRRHFFGGYFLNRRHAVITGCVVLLLASAVAAMRGQRGVAAAAGGVALVGYFAPPRRHPVPAAKEVGVRALKEAVQFSHLLYASARWRRILL
ncbi:MAG: glycosyltransferase family 2 protein [Candidatus Dormibacteraeota bacterium]|nr:glycosyltransferase family 2 protein [Candidatus Dormibacteraeota bacterium]